MKQETAQHTPGPWSFSPGSDPHNQAEIWRDDGRTIAVTYSDKGSTNARLIAASPELLSVLCGFIALYDQGQLTLEGDSGNDPLIIAARAAIAATQP